MSDAKSVTTTHCWNCGVELGHLDYGRQDICKKCGLDTRVCRNCIFWDKNSNNECRESQADRVVEKTKSNFCDYFKPKSGAGGEAQSRDAMKAAAAALFKKKS